MNEALKTPDTESLKNNKAIANFQRETDLAYERAANIFRVAGFTMVGLFCIGCSAALTLMYMQKTLTLDSAVGTFLQPRTLVVGMGFLVFEWTATSIKAHSQTAVMVGRFLAILLLAVVPIGTIFGIIALIRLLNKNLR
jgi:hypothetical protein